MTDQAAFGRYRLIAQIGSGGMADVFLAASGGVAGFSKLQVIKRLREDLAYDHDFIAMLVDEARISARLNHPNVVQTNEVGEVDGRYFIAMEYLDGQPFHRIIHRLKETGVPLDLACVVVIDALKGLHHAHELADYDGTPLHVVHRDLTPHNVFVTYDGVIKVVDFGIAKARGRTQQTEHGIVKGKIRYMAPEQVATTDFDRRVDLFSVGIMLWELVTKQRFWPNRDDGAVLSSLVRGVYESSPRAVDPQVDPELDRICRRALAFEAADRYANAAEFASDLEAFLGDRNEKARRQLGLTVSELFADKRAEIKQLVEAHMAGVRPVVVPLKLDSLAPPNASDASPNTGTAVTAAGSSVSIDAPSESSAPPAKRRRLWVVGAVLVIAAAAVLAAWGAARKREEARSIASGNAFASTTNSPAPAPRPESSTVIVSLRATPADAVLHVDDGPPLENPQVLRLPKDSAPHVVRVDAPGFESKSEPLSLAGDAALSIALERSPDGGADAQKAPPSGSAAGRSGRGHGPRMGAGQQPSPAASTSPGSPGPRKPSVDTSDPWR